MTDELAPAVAIVTGEREPELTADGQRVAASLADWGYRSEPVRWDRAVDWTGYEYALFRSCYEYPTDPARFRDQLDAVEQSDVTVCNPLSAVRWNVHKSYVTDLAEAGVPIPETTVVERGAETTLAAEMERLGLEEAIVKPAIGTGSDGVFRVQAPERVVAESDEARFAELLADGDVLVQAYAPDVTEGERSIAFFDGEYSHAWNSPTTADDVTRFEGNDHGYVPPDPVIDAAAETCRVALEIVESDRPFPYARVDYVRDGSGGIVILELELIEPILHLKRHDAVERFCEAVHSYFEDTR